MYVVYQTQKDCGGHTMVAAASCLSLSCRCTHFLCIILSFGPFRGVKQLF